MKQQNNGGFYGQYNKTFVKRFEYFVRYQNKSNLNESVLPQRHACQQQQQHTHTHTLVGGHTLQLMFILSFRILFIVYLIVIYSRFYHPNTKFTGNDVSFDIAFNSKFQNLSFEFEFFLLSVIKYPRRSSLLRQRSYSNFKQSG